METFKLKAEKRENLISPKKLRQTDTLPAVIYGKGVENVMLQVNYQDFRKVYRKAGSNSIIDLDIGGKSMQALVHRVDVDPVTGLFSHIDFINVNMNEEVTARIPLEFVGVALAVKDLGGILVRSKKDIHIKCLPGKLVPVIQVDISPLINFHTTINVGDLKLPEGIKALDNARLPVATVTPTKEEVEEVQQAATTVAGPEILKQGPEEAAKEGEAAAAGGAKKEEKKEEKKDVKK